jgi:hypothetical protein
VTSKSWAAGDRIAAMSSGIADSAVETCEIVWWSGYVKGRFQAYTSPASRAPVLIAESPPIRWRAADPPGPTAAAVEALEELTSRLAEDGWVAAEPTGNSWFGLLLTRPSGAGRPVSSPPVAEDDEPVDDAELDERALESVLLEELRRELREARDEAERERRRRIEAESGLRLVHPPPPRVRSQLRPRFAVVAYIVAVGLAATIFLVGFGSLYATAVAALTTAAVALALDSWLVARRRV